VYASLPPTDFSELSGLWGLLVELMPTSKDVRPPSRQGPTVGGVTRFDSGPRLLGEPSALVLGEERGGRPPVLGTWLAFADAGDTTPTPPAVAISSASSNSIPNESLLSRP
jgi:hypothetical protein